MSRQYSIWFWNIIKLKPNQKFIYVSSCFDYTEYSGNYVKMGDTIWFNYEQKPPNGGGGEFAIIRYQNAKASYLDYYSPKINRHAITKRIILLDTVALK